MTPEELKLITDLGDRITKLQDLVRRHKHADIESVKLNDGITTISMSFETGEAGATKVYFPFAVRIRKIRGTVTKQIAATDNGTIQGANADGSSTNGLITATAADVLATDYSVMPTTNFLVGAGSYYKLTSAKTTAGGKVLTTLEWERI